MMKNGPYAKSGGRNLKGAFSRAIRAFGSMLPQLFGVLLLIGFFQTVVTTNMLSSIFTGSIPRDTLIASAAGSISAGNPVTSYIIGGELLSRNVSLFAVTAFIVSWVTVGIIQLPAEVSMMGRRFALLRNLFAFVLAIAVALGSVTTLEFLR